MGFFKKLDHHVNLMTRMAETVHVDLGEALAHESLSGQDLRSAAMACIGCEGGKECPDWLAGHAQGADVAPTYCRNRALFARLVAA